MNPVKLLEPHEKDRYDYLERLLEEEFAEDHLAFHISGILPFELLNILSACAHLFEEFGFPESEDSRLLYSALTVSIAEYLRQNRKLLKERANRD